VAPSCLRASRGTAVASGAAPQHLRQGSGKVSVVPNSTGRRCCGAVHAVLGSARMEIVANSMAAKRNSVASGAILIANETHSREESSDCKYATYKIQIANENHLRRKPKSRARAAMSRQTLTREPRARGRVGPTSLYVGAPEASLGTSSAPTRKPEARGETSGSEWRGKTKRLGPQSQTAGFGGRLGAGEAANQRAEAEEACAEQKER
jgi:hypothetical protein